MNDLNAMLMLLGLEGFAVASVALIVVIAMATRRRRRVRDAMNAFIAKFKTVEAMRNDSFKRLLAQQRRLSGVELQEAAERYQRLERKLYHAFVVAIRQSDRGATTAFLDECHALVDAYREFVPVPPALLREADAAKKLEAEKNAEIEALKTKLERKEKELLMTNKTMEQIMKEYSAMFVGGTPAKVDEEEVLQKAHIDKGQMLRETEEEYSKLKTAERPAIDISGETPSLK